MATPLKLAQGEAAALDPAPGAARQWAHLLPAGDVRTRDGRRYRVSDPRAVVAAFDAAKVHLPVDFEHGTEAAKGAAPVPAAGWITAMEARKDGVWGLIEWNAKAAEMIAAREYRYLSPAILFDPTTREVRALRSAGLVHHPAMHLTALASEEAPMQEPKTAADVLAALAEALELDGAAGVDDVVQAIQSLRDKAARSVPADAVAELMRDRNLKVAQMSEREVELRVEKAIDGGYMTPAMREWALDLCRSDPESFDTFMAKAIPVWAHLLRPKGPWPKPKSRWEQDDAATIAAQLGVSVDALKGD